MIDHTAAVPNDAMATILGRLDTHTLGMAAQVCRRWRALCAAGGPWIHWLAKRNLQLLPEAIPRARAEAIELLRECLSFSRRTLQLDIPSGCAFEAYRQLAILLQRSDLNRTLAAALHTNTEPAPLELVWLLLDLGAEPTVRTLNAALRQPTDENLHMAKLVVQAGVVPEGSTLNAAICSDASMDVLRSLVARGAKPDAKTLNAAINRKCPAATFVWLLENGARPTAHVVQEAVNRRVEAETVARLRAALADLAGTSATHS